MSQKKIRNPWKTKLLIAVGFFFFFLFLSLLRNKFHQDAKSQTEDGFTINHGNVPSEKYPLTSSWKYKSGDDTSWASKNLNDNNWLYINPKLIVDSLPGGKTTGIFWLRNHFQLQKEMVDKIIYLSIDHYGASEIYLDGNFLMNYGKVANSIEGEVIEMPKVPLFFTVHDTTEHVFAIRYSNNHYAKINWLDKSKNIGLTFRFNSFVQESVQLLLQEGNITFWFIALFVFFLTLSIVHSLLYLFYPKLKQNLHYAIFMFLFSLLMLAIYLLAVTDNPITYLGIKYFYMVLLQFFIISINVALYSLFKPPFGKRILYIQTFICMASLITFYIKMPIDLDDFFVLGGALLICIEAVRSVIFALRKKVLGAKIIGTGVLVFFFFIFIIFFEAFVFGTINFNFGQMDAIYLFSLSLLCIISIPLSMSIYLAYIFAHTNKNLEEKLIEVKELSEKSIEQEKEKRQILADQNQTLENQVVERTIEITEQKKEIEEKNKDIIDSINYAKRIQSAMLPDEASFKSIFSSSFVLYAPRDIVSGDFYYATEQKGKKLIIAADCTGHGVPGALMSMVGCNIINKITHENGIIEPKIVLQTLHTELRHALKQNLKGSMNRDGMDVSAVLINENEIIFAGANRPLIWFNQKGELQELKPTKTPIGGSHIEEVVIQQITLPKADIKQLFLFSDGFADQFGGPEGKKLMISKFKLWLSQIINLKPEEQNEFLEKNFAQWKQQSEQVDDVMVIGIKIA